jgi:hypothetical protein
VEPDPNLHRRLRVGFVGFGNGSLHGNGTAHGVQWAGERRHEPVAEVLHLFAPGVVQRLAQEREVTAPHLFSLVITEPIEQFRRANHVGEEQGDDAA